MSIRLKILLILALGIMVSLAVSALAYLKALHFDQRTEQLLTQYSQAIEAVSQAQRVFHTLPQHNAALPTPATTLDLDRSINTRLNDITAHLDDAPVYQEQAAQHARERVRDALQAYGTQHHALTEVRLDDPSNPNLTLTLDRLHARSLALEQSLDHLAHVYRDILQQRRDELQQQRVVALIIIACIMIGGVLVVGLLGVFMSRGISRSFRQLLSAARNIQSGNLEARVRIKTFDELHELGQAFNAMARYLQDRRKRQVDYNELVSLLNSTLDLHELLAGSLREIVQRSGSALGAVYLVEPDGRTLTLGESFGLDQDTQHKTVYEMGEGLVGQAAKKRRKILVGAPIPGTLPIDSGVGRLHPQSLLILPLVHLDRLLGVFVLASLQPYPEDTLTFIEEVVFQVGVALNNARFVETIEATASALRDKTSELIAQRARLEQVNRDLESANRLQSDFLANVTHELRTPLNSVIGFTELVRDNQTLSDKHRRHLDIVLRNATGLLGLINDLLDITKIEAGRTTVTIATVNLHHLAEEGLQTISPMVDRQRVTLESRLEDNLPSIWTDRNKIKQILLNLLSNAAKFTEEGSIRVDIRRLSDDFFELAVIDSGIGIHEEDLPFIFDKFRQVDGSTSRKYGGTGLGLTITSELVKLLGGTITAKSELGAGSTFIVRLPIDIRRRMPPDKPAARPVPRPTAAPRPAQPTPTTASHLISSEIPALNAMQPYVAHTTRVVKLRERTPDETPSPDPSKHLGDAFTEPHMREPTPVAVLAPPPTTSPSASNPTLEPAPDSNPDSRTVYIVLDGQTDALISLRTALRQESFKVKSAFIIKDALQMLEHVTPAAIFLGEPMPEEDDDELKNQLAHTIRDLKIPVVLIDPDTCCMLEGIDVIGNVSRPIDVEQIFELLGITRI